jgi:antirestriction protein ArdC
MALDVYEVITAKFIDALSKGVVPWRRPWNGSDAPHNYDTNTTAYLQSWIKVLKGDSRLILSAASAAQKAADNVLNVVKQVEATEDATEDRGDAFQLQEAA